MGRQQHKSKHLEIVIKSHPSHLGPPIFVGKRNLVRPWHLQIKLVFMGSMFPANVLRLPPPLSMRASATPQSLEEFSRNDLAAGALSKSVYKQYI